MHSFITAELISPEHYAPAAYYEIDTAFIPAHQWPLSLIELALSRGIEEHKLLRSTGIFREDITRKDLLLSPQQCFQLIENAQKHCSQHDISFLLGHRLFTDNLGAAEIALANARSLQEALDTLVKYQQQLCPLLTPRLNYEKDRLVIYWQDACGASNSHTFLLEMMATALSALGRWQTGASLPWQLYFTQTTPVHIEQYQVHLPAQVHFNAPVNVMAISRSQLHTPWKKSDENLARSAREKLALQEPGLAFQVNSSAQGFLAETYNYLHNNIHHAPNLEQTAADFAMSSASFKRKLKKHHSHFQAQYDLVRRDLAIMWLNQGGLTHEEVAQKLHFYDAANLRRAFKKWTGRLPQAITLMD